MNALVLTLAIIMYWALAAIWIYYGGRRDRARFRAFFSPHSGRAVSVSPSARAARLRTLADRPASPPSADVLSVPAGTTGREPAVPAGPTRRAVEAPFHLEVPLPPARRPLPVDARDRTSLASTGSSGGW